jgi:hypothetical protein
MSNACDACGWAAAFGGMLAFGTFGVPIKSKVAQSVDIDPLVMQTYKTTMCFLTSWLILLSGTLRSVSMPTGRCLIFVALMLALLSKYSFLVGEEFTFTPWGIVSCSCRPAASRTS